MHKLTSSFNQVVLRDQLRIENVYVSTTTMSEVTQRSSVVT